MYISFDFFTQLSPAVLLRAGFCGRLADLTTIPQTLFYRSVRGCGFTKEETRILKTGYLVIQAVEIQYLIGISSSFETFSFLWQLCEGFLPFLN